MSSSGMDGRLPITRHFFKVMMPGFLTKLRIPPAFCRKLLYGVKLEKAILSSDKGSWHVKVVKCCEGFIYFNEGWNNFVLHHSLNLGDFVVFEHKGKMHFDVYVFDRSACEKEFPMTLARETKKREPIACKKELPMKLAHETKRREPVVCKKEFALKLAHETKKREPIACKQEFPLKLVHETKKREPIASKKEFPLRLAHGIKREFDGVSIHKRVKHVKRERPLEAAASNSPGSSHFKATIKASNGIQYLSYMNVPVEFLKSNNLSQICSITLRDPLGKLWPVEVRSRNYDLRSYWYMANGWHEFYVSNKLKEGDVCVFELNHRTTRSKMVTLDVQISPAPI